MPAGPRRPARARTGTSMAGSDTMGMNPKTSRAIAISLLLVGCGGGGDSAPPPAPLLPDYVLRWNAVALDAVVVDHTPVLAQLPDSNVPGAGAGAQKGPNRTSRALAIVHGAIYDAVNSITRTHEPYRFTGVAPTGTSIEAAVAQAGHDACIAQWPAQAGTFDAALSTDLAAIPFGTGKLDGMSFGAAAAAVLLADRANDGSAAEYPGNSAYVPGTLPGRHRADPINPGQGFLTPTWGFVRPFVISSALSHLVPAPPALDSPEYAAAFAEVKTLGGDGIATQTTRTPAQTEIANFWAYDGTPGLGVPPRLYNQIARALAVQEALSEVENARLFALVNFAMADAGIACFYAKYAYNLWRPVLGIRESDAGTGPSSLGDGNASTLGDATWKPLGAPSSNTDSNDFTPNFPSYPSGHCAFGGALFQVLRRFFGTDAIGLTFTSDEYDGATQENAAAGTVRPLRPHTWTNLSQPEQENADSRVYLGIHWRFDETQGVLEGRGVGDEVFEQSLQMR